MTRNEPGQPISPPTFFALLLMVLSGSDFLAAPYDAARLAGPSGYWAALAAFLLALPLIALIVALQRRFPHRDLFETAPRIIGRPLALAGDLAFLGTIFIWLAMGLRDACDLILAYLLDRTPLWAVLGFLLLGAAYPAAHGLTGVSRLAAFVLIPTAALRLGLKILSFSGMTASHLLPLLAAHPLVYLRGGLALAGGYAPLAMVLLIHPRLREPRRLSGLMLAANGGATLLIAAGIVGAIGAFGAEYTQYFSWPNLAAVHRVNLPWLILEQVGVLFIIVWLTMFVAAMAFFLQAVASSVARLARAGDLRLPVAAVAVLAGSTALLPPDAETAHRCLQAIRHWGILPLAGYPSLILLISLLRGIKDE